MKLKAPMKTKKSTKSKPVALVVKNTSHCNRCGRTLTAQHSVLRGIGPVCGKRALSGLSDPYGSLTISDQDLIIREFDKVVASLATENLTLPHEEQHREALKAVDRVTALGAAYEILGQICNEVYNLMPTDVATAFAVEQLFVIVGNAEEGEKARKRIVKVANLSL